MEQLPRLRVRGTRSGASECLGHPQDEDAAAGSLGNLYLMDDIGFTDVGEDGRAQVSKSARPGAPDFFLWFFPERTVAFAEIGGYHSPSLEETS